MTDSSGMAISVQQMVFGNRNERSGTGLAFSRNPSTGERAVQGEFLKKAQGLDVGSGKETISIPALIDQFPEAGGQLESALATLETEFGDMMAVQFTIEDDAL